MAEIVFYQRFVISELTSPAKSVWESTSTNGFIFVSIEYVVDPVQIFAVVNVRNFCSVNIERVYCNSSWNIIPITHHVFFSCAHGESTTLHENHTRSGALFFFKLYLVPTHLLL